MAKLLEIIRSFIPNLEGLSAISSVASLGPSWILGALGTIALSLFGLSVGRTRSVISLLSIYVAFAFDRIFPFLKDIHKLSGNNIEIYWLRLGLFFTIYLTVFIIFNHSFIKKRISAHEYSLFWIFILSFIQLGFIISIIINIVPPEIVSNWQLGFYDYFSTQKALFFWAIIPLPVIFMMGKK